MIEKQNDLKEVIVHLRTLSGEPAGPRDLSGELLTILPSNNIHVEQIQCCPVLANVFSAS